MGAKVTPPPASTQMHCRTAAALATLHYAPLQTLSPPYPGPVMSAGWGKERGAYHASQRGLPLRPKGFNNGPSARSVFSWRSANPGPRTHGSPARSCPNHLRQCLGRWTNSRVSVFPTLLDRSHGLTPKACPQCLHECLPVVTGHSERTERPSDVGKGRQFLSEWTSQRIPTHLGLIPCFPKMFEHRQGISMLRERPFGAGLLC